MPFLDKLKEIINININLSKFININIINNPESKEKYSISEDKNDLNINYAVLEEKEQEQLSR